MTKRHNILQVPVDDITFPRLKEKINASLFGASSSLFLSTVNASFVTKCQKDSSFLHILQNSTNINTVDGVSLQLAADYLTFSKDFKSWVGKLFFGLKLGLFDHLLKNKEYCILKNRITGYEITKWLLNISEDKKLKIVIVNRKNSLSKKEDILSFVSNKYPNINLEYIEVSDYREMISNNYKCDILFVLLGESRQEYFIQNNISRIKAKVRIGVGGTFDMLTGNIRTIPQNFKSRGLEWVLRLVYNPNRFRKIIVSICYFPYLVYMSSLKSDVSN